MSDTEKGYRLCPGIFSFCLFHGSGKSYVEFIKELFNIFTCLNIEQKDLSDGSLRNACTSFMHCKGIGIGFDLLDNTRKITLVKDAFENNYEEQLLHANNFVNEDLSRNQNILKDAIASVLRIIELDDTIADEETFQIGYDFTSVKKAELFTLPIIEPAAFILGIWYYIITRTTNVNDSEIPLNNEIGKGTFSLISQKEPGKRGFTLKNEFLSSCDYPFELLTAEPDNDDTTHTSSSSYKDNSLRQIMYQAETMINPNNPEKRIDLAKHATGYDNVLTKPHNWRKLAYKLNTKYHDLNSDSAEFDFKIGEVYSIKTKCSFSSVYVNDEHSLSVGIQLGHQEWVGLLPFAVDTKENNDNTENASGWASQYARNWAVLKDAELEILFQVVKPISHTIHILLITTCSRKYNPKPIPVPSFRDLLMQDMYKNGAKIGRILRQLQYPLFWDKRKPIDEKNLELLPFPDGILTKTTLVSITESVFLLFEHLDEEQKALFRCGLFAEGGCIAETVLLNMALRNNQDFHSKSPFNFNLKVTELKKDKVEFYIREWYEASNIIKSASPLRFHKFVKYRESCKRKLSEGNQYYLDRLYISNAFALDGCEDKNSILCYFMGKSSLDDGRLYSAYGFIQKSIQLGLKRDSPRYYKEAIAICKNVAESENWSTEKEEQISFFMDMELSDLFWILDEYDWPE